MAAKIGLPESRVQVCFLKNKRHQNLNAFLQTLPTTVDKERFCKAAKSMCAPQLYVFGVSSQAELDFAMRKTQLLYTLCACSSSQKHFC